MTENYKKPVLLALDQTINDYVYAVYLFCIILYNRTSLEKVILPILSLLNKNRLICLNFMVSNL